MLSMRQGKERPCTYSLCKVKKTLNPLNLAFFGMIDYLYKLRYWFPKYNFLYRVDLVWLIFMVQNKKYGQKVIKKNFVSKSKS